MLGPNPQRRAYVLSGVTTEQGGAVDATIGDRAAKHGAPGRLHAPVCAFVIVFGVAKLAELLDWSRLHADVVALLGLGSGTVTALLLAGKGAELLLTALAVLALARRDRTRLLAALAGWTADLALLAIVATVGGDLGRVLEHGLTFLAFAALLAVTYLRGRAPQAPETRPDPPATTTAADVTRQDLPVKSADTTRLDLPVRRPDVTRQDMPVQGRRRWPPQDG
jgi:hypothetical protein